MQRHALVERSVLTFRLLTGPLRLLAKQDRQAPSVHDPEELDEEYSRLLKEADSLNPCIPSFGM